MSKPIPNSETAISSVRYFDCGYCINQLAHAFRGHPKEKRRFPAGVFLLKHPQEGYLLFDTGYSRSIFNTGVKGWLYRKLNPTFVTPNDEIITQLRMVGVEPEEITHVILSHLHPDHIGGVKFFPHSKFVLSQAAYQGFEAPRVKDLLFSDLLPDWFESKIQLVSDFQLDSATGLRSHDLFGDGSLILVDLEGHAKGQIGALVPNQLLLAADACWGRDLENYVGKMSAPAKLIQFDYSAYTRVIAQLQKLREKGLTIYYSHEACQEEELLT